MGWTVVHGHDICLQDSGFSCGMTAVAMVVNLTGNGKPTEKSIMQVSKESSGSYVPGISDKSGMVKVMHDVIPKAAFAGTYCNNLGSILTTYKITNVYVDPSVSTKSVSDMQKKANSHQPLIAHINWTMGGGGHFIVIQNCSGAFSKKMTIYDPASGLVQNLR